MVLVSNLFLLIALLCQIASGWLVEETIQHFSVVGVFLHEITDFDVSLILNWWLLLSYRKIT